MSTKDLEGTFQKSIHLIDFEHINFKQGNG